MAGFRRVNKHLRLNLPLRLHVILSRYRKAMTLGVRVVVFGEGPGVFLVRHTYTPGWHFPGGGVDPSETAAEAAARELDEEGGIRMDQPPELFGLYLNRAHAQRDHVAVFVCRSWTQARPPRVPNLEIAACRFFPVDALPDGTTEPTRRRLAEILHGAPRAADW